MLNFLKSLTHTPYQAQEPKATTTIPPRQFYQFYPFQSDSILSVAPSEQVPFKSRSLIWPSILSSHRRLGLSTGCFPAKYNLTFSTKLYLKSTFWPESLSNFRIFQTDYNHSEISGTFSGNLLIFSS